MKLYKPSKTFNHSSFHRTTSPTAISAAINLDSLGHDFVGLNPVGINPIDHSKVSTNLDNLRVGAFLKSIAIGLTTILTLSVLPTMAQAEDALQMKLQANKVELQEDGSVVYIPVSTAESGTVIQYRATYTNTIDKPINDVKVTLPVPINMTFNGEVYPASAQASIDSINFYDMPLMRRVNGKLTPVPFSEYRALRWNIKLLPAKKTADVALNAVVD